MNFPTALSRGMITLTLLMLLSSTLFILMLLDDDVLRLHSALASQRAHYVERSLSLQSQSLLAKESACQNVETQNAETVQQITIIPPDDHSLFTDDIQHYIWCERYALFKKSPTKAVLSGQFSTYINEDYWAKYGNASETGALYWFSADYAELELTQNIYAVVVAQGDLHISGKGTLRGSVITKGKFTQDDDVKISYNKATVASIVKQWSRWQRAEKSWNDFKPLSL